MFQRLLTLTLALGVAAGSASVAEAKKKNRAHVRDRAQTSERVKAPAGEQTVLLGTQTLEPGGGSATIDVSRAKGAFKAIRVRAEKGPIDITGLRFVYADSSFHTVDKSIRLSRGEQTKALDERNQDRFVDAVIVNYKGAKKPMTVEILGVQTAEGAKKDRSGPASPPVAAVAPPSAPVTTATLPAAPATVTPPPPPKPAPVYADPASISEGRDVMFGYQTVGLGIDHDKISVGSGVGKFNAMRLKVSGSDIHINDLDITYADGSTQGMAINADVKAGQKTKWLKVNNKEFIKDIHLGYKAKSNAKGQARVEVLGQYADGWLASGGEGRKFNQGWVMLGSQTAGAFGFDKDTVSVGRNEGGFRQVRLTVRDRSITLREVRVVFDNGPDEVIQTNDRVDPDQIAGPWELKAGRAAIKEIVAKYRTRLVFGKGQGAAVVEFWAQH